MSFGDMIKARSRETGTVNVEGMVYTFYIVDPRLEPDLPWFVGYVDDILFISADVPRAHHKHFIGHEVRCRILYADQEGCCLRALKEELRSFVPASLLPRYIQRRLQFFNDLFTFLTASGKTPDTALIREIRASRDHLQSLV